MLRAADQVSFLGRGWTVGLANEAALKLRESAQLWTESYPAMEYRHGPISIAAPGRVTWAFGDVPDGLAEQVRATGAHFEHAPVDPLADLVRVHRLCLVAAADRGLDPDRPRHLSRSIILTLVTLVLAVDVGGSTIKAEVQDGEHRPVRAGRRRHAGGRRTATAGPCWTRWSSWPASCWPTRRGRYGRSGSGCPGSSTWPAGSGVRSANLGWRDAPVAAHLGAALGLPVVVSHDVAAAGQAELRLGAGRGARDALFVVIGTGIAGAVLAAGSLVTGGAGQAGEIGHIRIRPTGPRCGCGARGCLETFASARAIATAYAERTGRTVAGAADVLAALPTDADARAVWADAVAALADGLLITQAVLASELVVLGGGLASAGPALLDPLAAALRERATVQAVPRLRTAELGERAGVVGVAMAARATQR